MKLSDVKDKIDNYFNNITPEEVVKMFEDWGIELEDIEVK
jgi:hypothetical protein